MDVLQDVDDSEWPEVMRINAYATTMGILLVGIKGLSVLVFTWTTVVLLGGFVPMLRKEDFWSLTVISLVQLAGAIHLLFLDRAFHLLFSEHKRGVVAKLRRLMGIMSDWFSILFHRDLPLASKMINILVLVVILPVFGIIMCPVIVVLVFGIYISMVISLWRLIEQDYGNADGGANLKPALVVLYSLAVCQGVLYISRGLYALMMRTRLKVVEQVEESYHLHDTKLVQDYVTETVAECGKNPFFAKGRNLVTYAVDMLMTSKRPDSYISGLKSIVLASLWNGRRVVVKQFLIDSTSLNQIVSKLLWILHSRSQYSRETRENTACILAFLVDEIHLEQFPGGIQCISSLLDTSEEYPWLPETYKQETGLSEISDQKDWLLEIQERHWIHSRYELGDEEPEAFDALLRANEQMVLQGFSILGKLADNEDNCKVIGNTPYLLSRITAPLISSRLHQEHHDAWSGIAEESLKLVCKLMAAPGEAGAKLRCLITSNSEPVSHTLRCIFQCGHCQSKVALLTIVMEVLLDLSLDTSSIMESESGSTTFITVLICIFLRRFSPGDLELFQKLCSSIHWIKKRRYIRNLAGEKLAMICSQSERNATLVIQVASSFLDDLTITLVDAKVKIYRIRAAEILEHLCSRCSMNDRYLKELMKAMANVMPKVLREVLCCGLTRAGIQTEINSNKEIYSVPGAALHDNGRKIICSSDKHNATEHENHEPKDILLSLCATVSLKLTSEDHDLVPRFDDVAAKICLELGRPVKRFHLLVKEMQELMTLQRQT